MSIHKAWYINCDECYNPFPISTDSAVDARRIAKTDGMVRKRVDGEMKDLCEHCAGTATPERTAHRQALSDMERQNKSGRF